MGENICYIANPNIMFKMSLIWRYVGHDIVNHWSWIQSVKYNIPTHQDKIPFLTTVAVNASYLSATMNEQNMLLTLQLDIASLIKLFRTMSIWTCYTLLLTHFQLVKCSIQHINTTISVYGRMWCKSRYNGRMTWVIYNTSYTQYIITIIYWSSTGIYIANMSDILVQQYFQHSKLFNIFYFETTKHFNNHYKQELEVVTWSVTWPKKSVRYMYITILIRERVLKSVGHYNWPLQMTVN